MPTITTKETGGRSLLMTPMSFTAPEQEMVPDAMAHFLSGTGLNAPFLADLLSSFLAHEQCGYHLYLVATGVTRDARLRERYEHFGRETENHIRILEELITRLGGNPGYVSPAARLVEATGAKLLEVPGLLNGTAHEATVELTVLEAVVLAETKDHADWRMLQSLTDDMPEGEVREAFRAAVDQVEQEEDEHLTWATTTWERLVMTQVKGG